MKLRLSQNPPTLKRWSLAGEPLDIKVNNILLGKAEVVVVNEKYGLRVLEFNTRDINELAP